MMCLFGRGFLIWVMAFLASINVVWAVDTKTDAKDKAAKGFESYYGASGWGRLDNVINNTPYSMLFYSDPRGLMTQLSEGMVVRIRSLKTGFGAFYNVKKDKNGKWRLYADSKDPKDPAAHFVVHIFNDMVVI